MTHRRCLVCYIFKNTFQGLFKKIFGKNSALKGGAKSAERVTAVQKAKVRLTEGALMSNISVQEVISPHKKEFFIEGTATN